MADLGIKNQTAIVGVGYSPVIRKAEKGLGSFAVEAARNAIADAGLTRDDIDGYVGSPGAPNYSAVHADGVDEVSAGYMIGALGLKTPRVAMDGPGGMTTGQVMAAAQALYSGTCNYVLLVRAMYNPVGVRYAESRSSAVGGPEQYLMPYGVHPIGRHAQWLQRYMHDYGATREELFTVARTLREHAQLNPIAYWRGKELTLEDYMSSRYIFEPMCVYDCDIPVTTAGAIVMTTAERARDLPNKPAYITAFASNNQPGNTVFDLSGVDRKDVQVAQIYEGFLQFVWYWLEKLEFCGKGEAHSFTQGGRISLGGELPITTFGGSQGEGRLHGMGHIREGAMQVMGRAGERQVPNVEHCVVAVGFEWIAGYILMLSSEQGL